MTCNGTESQKPYWAIRFESSENFHDFSFDPSRESLNQRGFFNISSDTKVIQLVIINATKEINDTEIRCIDGSSNEIRTISQTILVVYSKSIDSFAVQNLKSYQ